MHSSRELRSSSFEITVGGRAVRLVELFDGRDRRLRSGRHLAEHLPEVPAHDEVMQAASIPVAHTRGTDSKPTERNPVEDIVRWTEW